MAERVSSGRADGRRLTLAQVAADNQVTERWLRRFIRRRAIPVLRSGRIVRFDKIALDALREALCPTPEPVAPRLTVVDFPPVLPKQGYVYFIQVTDYGPIKIGLAADVRRRLKHLQTAHFAPLRLVGVVPGDLKAERALHAKFKQLQSVGEWHRPEEELLLFIEDLPYG